MKKEDLRIIYMGTPEFAVEPLRELYENGYNVVCVVTMPDKRSGRGMKMQSSDVKKYATSVNIPVLQPEKLKNEDFLNSLKSYKADLQIVVAFRMLPVVVWDMPKFGTFNLHASLLPQYRGAAPINWAVINGDKETGVTTFFLKHEIDTGDIILQEKLNIGEDECVGSVHDRLMRMGGRLVKKTVDLILEDKVKLTKQDEIALDRIKPAPKLFKENTRIDWNMEVKKIYNLIRGLNPYPASWSILNNNGKKINVKIYEAHYEKGIHDYEFGKIISDKKKYLKVATKDGFLFIDKLQMAGRKAVDINSFLCGLQNIDDYFFE